MFAKRLKLARHAKGLSMRELAPLVGVSAQAIAKYENDKAYPQVSVLVKLSQALGVSMDFLMGNEVKSVTFELS